MCTLGPLFNHSTIRNAFSWSFRLEIKQTGLSYLGSKVLIYSISAYRTLFLPFKTVQVYVKVSFLSGADNEKIVLVWFCVIMKSSCCSQKLQHKQSFLLCSFPFKWLWNTPRNANVDPPPPCLTAAYKTDRESPHSSALFYFFPPRHPVESVFLWDT